MRSENIFAVLGNISRLITQAEQAPKPQERAQAIKLLKPVRDSLKADLHEAEAAIRAGATGRKVEVAALRAAHTTLAGEISIIESAESVRTMPLLRKKPSK